MRRPAALLLLLLVAACHPGPPPVRTPHVPADAKFDAALRQAVRQASPDALLAVFVEFHALTEETRRQAEADGLRIATVVGATVTAEGTPEVLRRVAARDFVRALALSQQRSPSLTP
jgi:hypothetical protein